MTKPLVRLLLPIDFVSSLGYERAVANSAYLARSYAQVNNVEAELAAPRRFVGLYWESSGDHLAYSDGVCSGAGILDSRQFQRWRHEKLAVFEWDHSWSLGSSDGPETHWLLCDRETGRGYIYPIDQARAIVRAQALPDGYAG